MSMTVASSPELSSWIRSRIGARSYEGFVSFSRLDPTLSRRLLSEKNTDPAYVPWSIPKNIPQLVGPAYGFKDSLTRDAMLFTASYTYLGLSVPDFIPVLHDRKRL